MKRTVNFSMQNFKAQLKEISDTYTNCILDTQSQTLDSIENQAFATPINRQAEAVPGSSSNTRHGGIFMDDYSDTEDDTVRTSDDVITLISKEIEQYAKIQLYAVQKESMHLISWWKERKK